MESHDLESAIDPTRRIYELTTLYEVSRVLLSSRTPEHLAFDALTAAMGLAGSGWGILWTSIDSQGSLRPLSICGRPASIDKSVSLPHDWVQFFTERPQPLMWRELSTDSFTSQNHLTSPLPTWLDTLKPELLLPLSERGNFLGLMGLGPNPLNRPHEPFLIGLLGSISHLVAIALGRHIGEMNAYIKPAPPSIQDYRQQYPILCQMVGESQAVLDLYENLTAVAQSSCTVLFEGETGSGKELAARVLHKLSPRQDGPFIEVDCGSIPENLIESELFGHTKGSFTGATQDRRGVFELANSGTLFLDEVANLPLQTQNRLLRVLQERRFRPVGGEQNIEVDVRVVAASNRDLRNAVEDGSFREDLFYRLYVYPIRVAPLREHKEDIPSLAAHYLERCATDNSLPVPRMTDDFVQRLMQHDFPGNVRELRHLVEWSLLRSTGEECVSAAALDDALNQQLAVSADTSDRITSSAYDLPIESEVDFPRRAGVERGIWVVEMLRRHRFNVKATAETLTTLSRKDPDNPPPLTDRSSLTYYFQVECFRLYLENGGDILKASAAIAGEEIGSVKTVGRRMAGYLNSATLVLEDCLNAAQARQILREKFLKLPEDYLTALDRLADHLWEKRATRTSE